MTSCKTEADGDSLGECTTNVFVLADARGLRWKKYSASCTGATSISEDPILCTYSKALSHDLMCVWQRSNNVNVQVKEDPGSNKLLNCPKELVLFWYGEEPLLTGVISPSLKEVSSGAFENGFSVEYQNHFYKALHSVIERHLWSSGFVRLGKWFMEPVNAEISKKESPAFSFSFFIYGESLVAATVEVDKRPAFCQLSKDDVTSANSCTGLPSVILAPYGLKAFLTGNSLPHCDAQASKLINDWSRFFCLSNAILDYSSNCNRNTVPPIVEVAVKDTRMLFPSKLVLLPFSKNEGTSVYSKLEEASSCENGLQDIQNGGLFPSGSSCETLCSKIWRELGSRKENIKPSSGTIKTEGLSSSSSTTPLWDFRESLRHSACGCTSSSNVTRTKPVKKFGQGPNAPRSTFSPSNSSPMVSSPVTPQGGAGVMSTKAKRETKRPGVFHKRVASLSERALTPPLLPVLPGPRTLHTPSVLQSFNSVPTVCEENSVGRSSRPYAVNNKLKLEQIDSNAENSRIIEKSLSDVQHQFAQLKSSISASCYLSKKVFKRSKFKTKPLFRLPATTTIHPPILKEDRLQTSRPSEDFSVYSRQWAIQELPRSVEDVTWNSSSAFSPESYDPEKMKRNKRPIPLDAGPDTMGSKVKKSEPSPGNDALDFNVLGNDQRQNSDSSGRIPHPHGSEKKQRGPGRPRPNKSSNSVSPKVDHSPLGDVFSPGFDDDAAWLSPTASGNKGVAKVKDAPLPVPSPTQVAKATKTGHGRGKKRLQAGRGRKDSTGQDNSAKAKEQCNALPNPPQSTVSSSSKNGPSPSPQSTHFSPPTPRHTSGSGFLSFNDLQVSENDLNMIFESDEEEDASKPFKVAPHVDGPVHHEEAVKSSFSQSIVTSSGLTQQDLAQMFPTPPSQEPPVHATSPATPSHLEYFNSGSAHAIAVMSPEKGHVTSERETTDVKVETSWSKVLPPVFQLPVKAYHPSGKLFNPLDNLPSSSRPSLDYDIPIYKPSNLKSSLTESRTTVIPPLRIKSPPDLAHATLSVSPGILCSSTMAGVQSSVPPGATIMRPQLPTPTEIPPLTPSPLIKTLRPEFPAAPGQGSYDMDSQSLRMTLILSDSVLNCFGPKDDESADVNAWLSEVDPKHWIEFSSNDNERTSCSLFCDDIPFTDAWAQLRFSQSVRGIQRRPRSLQLQDTNTNRSDKEKGKNEINQLFFKILSEHWSSPFSAQYLEDIIDGVYNKERKSQTEDSFSDCCLMEVLQDLRSKLQEALQKPLRRCSWEAAKIEGPATFHSFHKVASRGGLQGKFAVQPLLAGHDGDWISLSPYALRYWEKLMLEPYGGRRDVAYIAVTPDSKTVVDNTKWFLKELTSVYEALNMGQHYPITTVLTEGIMSLREGVVQKLAQETVDDWFTQGEGTGDARMKMIAQVCKGYLGPHLASSLAKFASDKAALNSDAFKSKSSGSPSGIGIHQSAAEEAILEEERDSVPAVMIYIVDPFQGQYSASPSTLWSVSGIFRSFAEMVHNLPSHVKENVFLQVVPVDFILRVKSGSSVCSSVPVRPVDLRQLALSVYSQCRSSAKLHSTAKALTGFGNALVRENLVFKRQNDNQLPSRVYLPPCILAQPPNLLSEEVFSLNGLDKALKVQDINTLFCGYCVSQDQKWLYTVCSDRCGEISETCVIKISTIKRNSKSASSSRQNALRRLWHFVYNILSFTTNQWRLVFNRFGKPGQGELQDFMALIRRMLKAKTVGRTRQYEACRACNSAHTKDDCPVIQSVTYATVDTETGIRLLHRTKATKSGISRSRVYIVPPLQNSANRSPMQPPVQQTTVGWRDRGEESFLSDPTSLLLGNAEEDVSDTDFLPLLTSPADPNNLVYGPDLISPSSEIQDCFLTEAAMTSSGICDGEQTRKLSSARLKTNTSPFQPISQKSACFGSPLAGKSSPGVTPTGQGPKEEGEVTLDQPLAIGYLLSSGGLSRHCGSALERASVIRSELRFHIVNEDAQPCLHVLDSTNNLEILRYLMEQLDSLSWLTVDSSTGERRSQLPVHLYLLKGMALYFQQLYS